MALLELSFELDPTQCALALRHMRLYPVRSFPRDRTEKHLGVATKGVTLQPMFPVRLTRTLGSSCVAGFYGPGRLP